MNYQNNPNNLLQADAAIATGGSLFLNSFIFSSTSQIPSIKTVEPFDKTNPTDRTFEIQKCIKDMKVYMS